jgi:hypothetical protein
LQLVGGHDVAAYTFSQQIDRGILVALSMISRRQATVETVTALLQNPSMMFILGVIALADLSETSKRADRLFQ